MKGSSNPTRHPHSPPVPNQGLPRPPNVPETEEKPRCFTLRAVMGQDPAHEGFGGGGGQNLDAIPLRVSPEPVFHGPGVEPRHEEAPVAFQSPLLQKSWLPGKIVLGSVNS